MHSSHAVTHASKVCRVFERSVRCCSGCSLVLWLAAGPRLWRACFKAHALGAVTAALLQRAAASAICVLYCSLLMTGRGVAGLICALATVFNLPRSFGAATSGPLKYNPVLQYVLVSLPVSIHGACMLLGTAGAAVLQQGTFSIVLPGRGVCVCHALCNRKPCIT